MKHKTPKPRRPRRSDDYKWKGAPVPPTYAVDGVQHKSDGTCHEACPDVR